MDRSDNPADRRGQQPECGAFRTARAMRRFRRRSPAQQAVRTASASQVCRLVSQTRRSAADLTSTVRAV